MHLRFLDALVLPIELPTYIIDHLFGDNLPVPASVSLACGFNLQYKQLLLKHHISIRNKGKHVLATSIFQYFLGGVPPDLPRMVIPAASQAMAMLSKISLWEQIW